MCKYTDSLDSAISMLGKVLSDLKETVTNTKNGVMINPLKSDAIVRIIESNRRAT